MLAVFDNTKLRGTPVYANIDVSPIFIKPTVGLFKQFSTFRHP